MEDSNGPSIQMWDRSNMIGSREIGDWSSAPVQLPLGRGGEKVDSRELGSGQ